MKIWRAAFSILASKRLHTSMVSRTSEHITSTVKAIYDLPAKPAFSLVVSGGGMQAIPMLLGVPGASACVMDASIPYSRAATGGYLVVNGDQHIHDDTSCKSETAFHLAKAAYLKTCNLLLQGEGGNSPNCAQTMAEVSTIFGVSCTAALVSAVPKKGTHRVHIGLYCNSPTGGHGTTYSMILTKGLRDRLEEDALCSRLILDVITEHVGLPLLPDSVLSQNIHTGSGTCKEDMVTVERHASTDALENITTKKSKHALYFSKHNTTAHQPSAPTSAGSHSQVCLENVALPAGTIVYPGSFNPLHDGHLSLVRAHLDRLEQQFYAAVKSNSKTDTEEEQSADNPNINTNTFRPPLVVFEIGAVNADKPPLPREEILRRLAQFNPLTNPLFAKWKISNFAVSITSEPLFLGKANIFPACDFLIGADTMVRLINPKYYVDNPDTTVDGGAVDSESRRVANMIAALSTIAANKCRFVVGGRVKTASLPQAGQLLSVFETCDSILHSDYRSLMDTSAAAPTSNSKSDASSGGRVVDALPYSIVNLFVNLSEEQFRLDLSSTELRNKAAASAAKHS